MNAKMKKGLAVLLALVMAVIPMVGNFVYADDNVEVSDTVDQRDVTFKGIYQKNDDGTVIVEYTKNSDGSSVYVKEEAEAYQTINATCQNPGGTVYRYTRGNVLVTGGEWYVENPNGTVDHTLNKEEMIITPADCGNDGAVAEKCTICGEYVRTGVIAKLGHDEVIVGYEALYNIVIDEVTGEYQVIDPSSDAYYRYRYYCKRRGCDYYGEDNWTWSDPIRVPHVNEDEDYDRVYAGTNVTVTNPDLPIIGSFIDSKFKVDDCTKDAVLKVTTYSRNNTLPTQDDKIVNSETYNIPAGTHSYNSPYKPDKNYVRYSNNFDPITGKNTSCAAEAWYTVRCSWCNKESAKIYVPKSEDHQAGYPVLDEKTDTSTCTEPGKVDKVTSCVICGQELKREKVDSPAKGHAFEVIHNGKLEVVAESKLRPESANYKYVRKAINVVPATQHYDGSYDSVFSCVRCDFTLGETIHTVTAKGPNAHVYRYAYTYNWGYEGTVFDPWDCVAIASGEYFQDLLTVDAVPQDEDVIAHGEQELRTNHNVSATKKYSYKVVKEPTHCEFGVVEFTCTVDGTFLKEAVVETHEYAYRNDTYQGHSFSTPYEGEDGNTHVTCTVCNEDRIIHYGDGSTGDVKVYDLALAKIEGAVRDYTGKKEAVPFKVVLNGKELEEGKDYVLSRENAFQNGGNHPMTITGIGEYTGEKQFNLVINRKEQKLQIKTANETESLTVKTASLEDGDQIFWVKVAGVKSKAEKVTVTSNSKYVTVTPAKTKAGYFKVTVSKGVKTNGTYRITAKAPKTNSYAAGTASALITVK